MYHKRFFLGLPTSVIPVLKATAFPEETRGPSVENVVNALKSNGIEVDSKTLMVTIKYTILCVVSDCIIYRFIDIFINPKLKNHVI